MKSWHQLLTRHQEHAPGVRDGRRVEIPLRRGDYKVRPNPRRYRRRHGNEGVTARDRDGAWRYHPPDMTPRELLILEGRAAPAPGEHMSERIRSARPS